MLDFLEIAGVSLEPVRRVFHSFRKVGLDGAGEMRGGSSRDETRADGHDGENEEGGCDKKCGANFESRRGSQSRPGEKRVEGGHREGETPNAGDGGELEKSVICGGRIAEQIPRKTNFWKMREGEFEGDPEKRRAGASQHQAALRETANAPGECAGQNAYNRSNEKQNGPAADARQAAVNGEHGGDPGYGSKNEKERVDEAASEGDGRARVQNDEEEKTDAEPGVDAEVKSGVGKRQRRAGDGGADQAKRGGSG